MHTANRIVGRTETGEFVITGVFALRGTYGLHLADVFDALRSRRLIASWRHFYADAVKDGWKHSTIIAQLSEALGDVYGGEFRDRVLVYVETLKEVAG